MNTDNQRWNNFINITDKEKNDENLKSIYYLKLYAKNKLNNKTEIMNKAKKNYISDISANIKEGDQLSLYCILDYLINRYNITNKEELIEILSNLNLENLNLIANSSNMLSYEKMKRNVANFEENDVSNFVKPLIIALNSINLNYEEHFAKVENEIEKQILKLYDCINNENYECFIIDNKTEDVCIYIYDNGLIIRYSFNGEFVDCIYNFLSKTIIKEIKKLININANEFDKYCKNIIKKGEIGDSTIRKIKSIEKYTLHSDLLGDFEVVRDENTDIYYYKINCKTLNFNNMENEVYIYSDNDYKENKIKKIELNKIVPKVEKLYEIQEVLIDKFLDSIVDICDKWEEVDKDANKITLEYVERHISPLEVIINIDETNYSIHAYLHSDKDDENYLLGDHTLILISGDNPKEAFFKLEG